MYNFTKENIKGDFLKKSKNYTYNEALMNYLVPKKDIEIKLSYGLNELEKLVAPPTHIPNKNAEVINFMDERLYRESECIKSLTTKELKKLGISSSEIGTTIPYMRIPIGKNKTEEFFDPRDFNLLVETSENLNKKTIIRKSLFLGNSSKVLVYLNSSNKKSASFEKHEYKKITPLVFIFEKMKLTVVVEKSSLDVMTENEFQTISDIKHLHKKTISDITKYISKNYSFLEDTFFSLVGYSHTIYFNPSEDTIKNVLLDHLDSLLLKINERNTFKDLLSNKRYHEQFPARKIKRKIIVYEAPTNSGKTYTACNTIKDLIRNDENANAACIFPLRALAAQIKDEFMEEGVSCSLITGEERELELGARVESITAEVASVSKLYTTVFIDESQLLFDDSRGSAYARAIIGSYAKNVILAVAPAYKNALIFWLKTVLSEDEIEEIELKRLCPLHPLEKRITKRTVEKGDIIVAFSVKEIHRIAYELSDKYKVGVIYGKMSPSSRRSMVRDFMVEDFDVLVATDAIGMGVSIPAKRVLFSALEKFDGVDMRSLNSEEIRQIAGRAGRYKFYDEGFYGTYELNQPIFTIERAVKMIVPIDAPKKLTISPDKHIFRSSKNLSLMDTINIWFNASIDEWYKPNERVISDLVLKAEFLDQKNLSKEQTIELLFVTFSENMYETYVRYVNTLTDGGSIESFQEKMVNKVVYYENYAQWLTLVYQLKKVFPEQCPDESWIKEEMNSCGEQLTEELKNLYSKGKINV